MLTPSQLEAVRARIEASNPSNGHDPLLVADARMLLAEVARLGVSSEEFTQKVMAKVDLLSQDMETLSAENARLRKVTESTYFERDACVGLIARLARLQGLPVGKARFQVESENGVVSLDSSRPSQTQDRVVVDLPSGQVSWEYLESEAHLFSELPHYEHALHPQTVGEIYAKVLNPNLPLLNSAHPVQNS